jgi:hypothetical protein
MKGIFRSVWIVWLDAYQGASRMDQRKKTQKKQQ